MNKWLKKQITRQAEKALDRIVALALPLSALGTALGGALATACVYGRELARIQVPLHLTAALASCCALLTFLVTKRRMTPDKPKICHRFETCGRYQIKVTYQDGFFKSVDPVPRCAKHETIMTLHRDHPNSVLGEKYVCGAAKCENAIAGHLAFAVAEKIENEIRSKEDRLPAGAVNPCDKG